MHNKTRYQKDRLTTLVSQKQSLSDILLELGLRPIESNYKTLKKYLQRYGIDYSKFKRGRISTFIANYDKEMLETIIPQCTCFADVKRKLGMTLTGNNNNTLRRYIKLYEIDISHFDPNKKRGLGAAKYNTIPLSEILVINSTYLNTHNLKIRLYKNGIKNRQCEMCGQGELWNGAQMSLILDHINGNHTDNRIENLRIVCPNCNATLPTHCGKKRKNKN